jgi:hypothetical protein
MRMMKGYQIETRACTPKRLRTSPNYSQAPDLVRAVGIIVGRFASTMELKEQKIYALKDFADLSYIKAGLNDGPEKSS